MRKYISLFIVIFLFGLMACTQVENNIYCPTGEKVNVTVVASQDDSQTKTHIGEHYSEGGYAVLWDESGESIALMERVTRNGEFSVQTVVSGDYTLSEDAKTATFMGLGLVANEASEGSTFDYVVISPSSAVNMDTENHSVVGLALPAVQKPKVDSYDPNASILVGSSLGNGEQKDVVEADLTHILAYAKMTVKNVPTDDKIETVEFITEKDIYGTVLKYNIEDGTVGSDSSIMSVKMDVSSIPQSGESFDVYFTALPTEFSPGDKFSVKVSTADRLYVKEWTMTDTKKFDLISQSVLTFSVDMADAEVGEVEWPVPDNEIWYVTSDASVYDIYKTTKEFNNQPFDVKVISNTYVNGIGVIKFAGPVKRINDYTFGNSWGANVIELYLPDTIESLGIGAIAAGIKTLRIPKNLKHIEYYSLDSHKLEFFTGHHVSDDRLSIVIDGTLVAFAAGSNVEEYVTPEGVRAIGPLSFSRNTTLKKIVISEGITKICNEAFMCDVSDDTKLEDVYLPSTLDTLDFYAFARCKKIKRFYGDNKFIGSDGYALFVDNYNNLGKRYMVSYASGSDLTSYEIPEGVEGIESYTFNSAENLKELSFPSTLEDIASADAFEGTYNIESISGEYVLDDGISLVRNGTLFYVAPKGLVSYTTPEEVTNLSYGVLSRKPDLETVVISDNVTTVDMNVVGCERSLGYILWNNPKLKTVTVSARMSWLGWDPFGTATDNTSAVLETVYLRAPIPPAITHNFPDMVKELFDDLVIYVPEASLEMYQASQDWAPYRHCFKGYDYGDMSEFLPDYYISKDYSKDGEVVTLQKASVGKGVNIVLMGDAYSDRQIADGTYDADMKYMYDNLFTQEPYKTYKDYFNVYYVNVVSVTEGYEYNNTALDGFFGSGTYVAGDDKMVFNYALNAISEEDMDEALLIVAMNSDAYAGTCFMYYPTETDGTYGSGPSVSYFPKGGDAETFASLLHHEACGHGFAKLGDEYAYEDYGEAPADYIAQTKQHQDSWGWWKNVDFTDDPSEVRWNYFLSDERYANDGLGVFEGGLTYWSGVWRPTENSIMRYNTGGFNAPSREAIYYRIHKLAYGADWEYNYEDFVEYDSVNRKSASEAAAVSATKYVYQPKPQLHAPVVINKTWRDAE